MIRLYTLPHTHLRSQYQTCYNLPLSPPKLWVVSQLCCGTLHLSSGPEAIGDAMGENWLRQLAVGGRGTAHEHTRSVPVGDFTLSFSLCFCDSTRSRTRTAATCQSRATPIAHTSATASRRGGA